jgi:UDP-glucose 6-dehydrogenase
VNIVIIGNGTVGKAIAQAYCKNPNNEVYVIDRDYWGSVDRTGDFREFHIKPELVIFEGFIGFVCLPYFNVDENGESFLTAIKRLQELKCKHVVVKSTLDFDALEYLDGLDYVLMPEFLTAANSVLDYASQPVFYHSGEKEFVQDFQKIHNCHMRYMSKAECILLKLFRNTFLASKVSLFNQFFEIMSACGQEDKWKNMWSCITDDPRIGRSHTHVPGPDGEYGFGGACFPKDFKLLLNLANNEGAQVEALEAIYKDNEVIRGLR